MKGWAETMGSKFQYPIDYWVKVELPDGAQTATDHGSLKKTAKTKE